MLGDIGTQLIGQVGRASADSSKATAIQTHRNQQGKIVEIWCQNWAFLKWHFDAFTFTPYNLQKLLFDSCQAILEYCCWYLIYAAQNRKIVVGY